MKVQVSQQNGVTIAELNGRLDALSAEAVRDELLRHLSGQTPRLVLDMKHVSYVSSAGLRTLFRLSKEAAATHGRLVLCGLSAQVRQVIDLAGYSALVAIHEDVAGALAAASA